MPSRNQLPSDVDAWAAGRIAFIYAGVAGVWIFFSDRILEAFFTSRQLDQITRFQTFKGLAFVLATAVLLWVLIRRRLKQMRSIHGSYLATRDRLDTVADNLPGIVLIKDAAGRFVFLRGRSAVSVDLEALLGKTEESFVGPVAYANIREQDLTVLRTGLGSQGIQTLEIDGVTRHFLVHRFPLKSESGAPWVGAISLDITERQNAETKIRLLAREMEAVNHQKDQFLSNLSHELRTPITAIRLWTDVLRSCAADERGTIREASDMIHNSAMAQSRLIDDMLEMTRIAAGKLKVELALISLSRVVRETVNLLAPMAEERQVTLDVLLAENEIAPIQGDARRVQQIFWNLMTNAIKYSNAGGHVIIRLERENDLWALQILDQGIGIGPELLPKLFERFRQADTARTKFEAGLGIGLSIVKYLTVAHNGSVTAESAGEGKGSTFTVRFPIAVGTPTELDVQKKAGPLVLSQRTILLVEDDADSRQGMASLLRRAGAMVHAVETADAALASEICDLLLSDIGLPGRDGYDLIQTLRKDPAWKHKPAIAVSAYATPEDKDRALSAGFDAFIVKPVDPDDLVAVVAYWLAHVPRKLEQPVES